MKNALVAAQCWIILGFLVLAAPGVEAKGVTISIEGVETVVSSDTPEEVWESGGIFHIRGQAARNLFVGTCGGEPCSMDVPFVLNLNLDLATGDGTVFGSFGYVVDGETFTWGDRVGRFDGRWWGDFNGAAGVVTIAFIAQGAGDFDGMILMGTGSVPLPSEETEHPIEATVLDPHG